MIRRSFVLGATAATLALSGCGGGSSTPTPSPTPTPTSTVTPTPTPASYTAFPLLAAAEFGTVDSFMSYTGDPTVGPVTFGAAGTEIGTTRFRAALQPDPSTATTALPVVIHENAEESRFVAADFTTTGTAPATTVKEAIGTQAGATAGATATIELLNNTTKDKITTDASLALTRVSYAGYIRQDSVTGQHRITYGVFGYPTIATDMPTTGTATYTAKIAGRTVGVPAAGASTVQKLGGTVTITVNFATGLVSLTANVTTIGAGGVETAYGTFSGTGAIASGATQFTGSFGPTSPLPGTFAGAFFGLQGEQIGVSYAGQGPIGAVNTELAGVIVGKKN